MATHSPVGGPGATSGCGYPTCARKLTYREDRAGRQRFYCDEHAEPANRAITKLTRQIHATQRKLDAAASVREREQYRKALLRLRWQLDGFPRAHAECMAVGRTRGEPS